MSFDALAAAMADEPEGAVESIPYARLLGARYRIQGDAVELVAPFKSALIGSPVPPRLHGGAVAGLMELGAVAQLIHTLREEERLPTIKPVNVTVDYLRGGQPEDTVIGARIVRLGRRIANMNVEAWQGDPDKPIAAAHMNIMLGR
ncbi:MAG: PaaI family thioesterase [Pacificimonas sp.]|jgi:acyl-coenzyme A thioesterase PaaI-like protein|nr:PaaI family thioesterase [Pacificimonas sp.]